jgi:hypothetical protein
MTAMKNLFQMRANMALRRDRFSCILASLAEFSAVFIHFPFAVIRD